MDIYAEFTLLLVIACGFGLVGMLLKQPLIVAFIVAGIVVVLLMPILVLYISLRKSP